MLNFLVGRKNIDGNLYPFETVAKNFYNRSRTSRLDYNHLKINFENDVISHLYKREIQFFFDLFVKIDHSNNKLMGLAKNPIIHKDGTVSFEIFIESAYSSVNRFTISLSGREKTKDDVIESFYLEHISGYIDPCYPSI